MHHDGVMLDRIMLVRAPFAEVDQAALRPRPNGVGPPESPRREPSALGSAATASAQYCARFPTGARTGRGPEGESAGDERDAVNAPSIETRATRSRSSPLPTAPRVAP